MVQRALSTIKAALGDVTAGLVEVLRQSVRGAIPLARKTGHGFGRGIQKLKALRGTSKKSDKPKKATPKGRRLGWLTGMFLVPGSLALYVAFAALTVNLWFASTVLPEETIDLWSVNRPASVTILDRYGEVLGERGIRYADPIPLDEIPSTVIDAFISTEDRRFFEHKGFDLRGLTRAAVTNYRAGSVVEGGSTITQQLAKNLFLGSERTILRKLQELQYALWLEGRLGKEQILQLYLNRIYLGSGTYGVEAAAQAYFAKSVREVTLAEAAVLAGLAKAPSDLSPAVNPKGAIERSREVLQNMVEAGRDDPVRVRMAMAIEPTFDIRERTTAHGYFLDHVIQRLEQRFGTLSDDLVVRTTFDPAMQALAEQSIERHLATRRAVTAKAEQAAMIVFDGNGGIVAMVGGRNYADSQFNRATQAKRQPGSAFKPFVFLAAMEAGLSPDTVVIDRPIKVGDWEPENYNRRFRGPMRLATAAARSTNTVAVQISEAIGRDRVIDSARRSGITEQMASFPSLALGAMEISLIDLSAGYLSIANHGSETPPHAVTDVVTRDGEEIYSYRPISGYRVIDPSSADDTIRLMREVVASGTATRGKFGGHDLAGKTGTTNEWRDAWFIGFSRYYLAGVWVGNDGSKPMRRISGGTIPLDIWRSFMTEAHKELEPVKLIEPRSYDIALGESEEPAEGPASLREVTGFYQSLRADLVPVAYPQSRRQIREAEEEENFRFGLGRIFGNSSDDDERVRQSQQPYRPTRVEARPAPGSQADPDGLSAPENQLPPPSTQGPIVGRPAPGLEN